MSALYCKYCLRQVQI